MSEIVDDGRLGLWKVLDPIGSDRDYRQEAMLNWALRTFGSVAGDRYERTLRLIEEAIELAHAEGVAEDTLTALVKHVYDKTPGRPEKEAAQVGVTLLIYCAATRISADDAEVQEIRRIFKLPKEHWRGRQDAKAAKGLGGYSVGTK